LTGILDWEFAAWSDFHEDIGWFCARCWRFGRYDREAGGMGSREAFYRGYERASGAEIDREAVYYWEVMAAVRWAVIALQQAERHLSGEEDSLELALTGRMVPEMEIDMLLQIDELSRARKP
ncbi:MAG: phosphotransferase, partial [Gammaproteobacteria bacterium]|nr:phosphotransferase [Gammaproteobacteria bacterium]